MFVDIIKRGLEKVLSVMVVQVLEDPHYFFFAFFAIIDVIESTFSAA